MGARAAQGIDCILARALVHLGDLAGRHSTAEYGIERAGAGCDAHDLLATGHRDGAGDKRGDAVALAGSLEHLQHLGLADALDVQQFLKGIGLDEKEEVSKAEADMFRFSKHDRYKK